MSPVGEVIPFPLVGRGMLARRCREVVTDECGVRAAFLYRRRRPGSNAERPTVGLVTAAGPIDDRLFRRFREAVAFAGELPDVVVLDGSELAEVVSVAAPIGAGGDLEHLMDGALDGTRTSQALLAEALAAAVVHLPAASDPDGFATGVSFALLRHGGRRLVPAFSSDLALLHTSPLGRGAFRVRGSLLVDALPDGVDVAVDPGCALTVAVSAHLLRAVSRTQVGA